MPFVQITIQPARPLTSEQIGQLQDGTTRLMATILRKRAELTAVRVDQAAPASWAIGGRPTPVAAHMDAKVTSGTNSAEEKERFIAAAAALLREVAGADLPVATYVVLHEVSADAWGYDGQTQERRRLAHQASAA
jgi:4-oxalocrotonate tautomerase